MCDRETWASCSFLECTQSNPSWAPGSSLTWVVISSSNVESLLLHYFVGWPQAQIVYNGKSLLFPVAESIFLWTASWGRLLKSFIFFKALGSLIGIFTLQYGHLAK